MKRAALLVCLAGLAGCSTDSAHSLSRDYRNLNNEAIDALMMCTSEARAQLARDKILKPYQNRLADIDKRFDTWTQNTDDKLIIMDTLGSESVATLLAEIPINKHRLDLELQRLGALVRARADAQQSPALKEIANGGLLSTLRTQLDKGNRFADLIPKFEKEKRWKGQQPPNMKELNDLLGDRLKALKPAT